MIHYELTKIDDAYLGLKALVLQISGCPVSACEITEHNRRLIQDETDLAARRKSVEEIVGYHHDVQRDLCSRLTEEQRSLLRVA